MASDIAGLPQPEQGWLVEREPWGSPPQDVAQALPALVATIAEAGREGHSQGVLLLNLTALPEAPMNKGHLIIEFLLWYL